MRHGFAGDGQLGRVFVQQALGRLGVGQHGGQGLVQLVRHAGGQLAHRVEPPDLTEPQQLFGALLFGALAQQGDAAPHHHGHQQRPGQHPGPRQFAPADLAQPGHIKRLAVGGQVFVKLKPPAACADTPRLQHIALRAAVQCHAHRAGVRRHRPFAPGHHGVQVQLNAEAGGLGGQHHLVTATGKVGNRQHGALQGTRLGFSNRQALIGPDGTAVAPLHADDLRVHRRQALLGLRGVGRRLNQRQHGHHGVMLHGALAQQPVGNAGIGFKLIPQAVQLKPRERHSAQHADRQPQDGWDEKALELGGFADHAAFWHGLNAVT